MKINENIIDEIAQALLDRLRKKLEKGLAHTSVEAIMKALKLTADAKEAVRFLQEGEKFEALNFETLEENLLYELQILEDIKNDTSSDQETRHEQRPNGGVARGPDKRPKDGKNARIDTNAKLVEFGNWGPTRTRDTGG